MQNRIQSVDLLRGITIAAMILVNNPGNWGAVYAPLLHADWHGYTPTDLVFPFFLFLVGTSIAFAYRNRKPNGATYRKILIRSAKLIGIGILLGAFTLSFPFLKPWPDIRLPGVLQRIGLVFLIAAPLALHLGNRGLLIVSAALLFGYWGWTGYLPLPDGSSPTLERAPGNWAMIVDTTLLGSHTWKPDYDPEGLLSTLPAIVTTLIGVIVGRYLLRADRKKQLRIIAAGAIMVLIGHLWHFVFPINKALWTSSFVIVTAGWACLCLGLIYFLTEVRGYEFGQLFKMAGANALLLYVLSSAVAKLMGLISVGDTSVKGWIYRTIFAQEFLPDKLSSLLFALTFTGIFLALGAWLYRRRLFWKV